MFEGFNPAKKERAAIDKAWRLLLEKTRDRYRSEFFMKEERRGYGNVHDKLPLIAAKGLCVKWFLDGIAKPNVLLRDFYFCRPAAIWFHGLGADCVDMVDETKCAGEYTAILREGVDAYDAAFDRMVNGDRAALAELARE